MRGHILVDEASKIQKCGQFLRGFKTLLNWPQFILNTLNLEFLNSLKSRDNLILKT